MREPRLFPCNLPLTVTQRGKQESAYIGTGIGTAIAFCLKVEDSERGFIFGLLSRDSYAQNIEVFRKSRESGL